MHTLVIFISIIGSSVFGLAKMPPPLDPQVETLKSVLARYHGQTSKFSFIGKQIDDLLLGGCSFTNGNNAALVTSCVVNIDRLVLEIASLKRSIPFIQENFREIPSAFIPIKSLLQIDLAEKETWLEGTSKKLNAKADELFQLTKVIIKDNVDLQIKDNESKARFEVICSSFRSHLNLHQKFANYFDSIHASYPKYERLRFQVAQTIWKMELLEGKCALIKDEDLARGNKLFAELTTKVDTKSFSKFKASICSLKNLSTLSKGECLRLPQTPEAVAVLESIQDKAGGHK